MDFSQNPFYLVGVTTRDDRRRIMLLAEEKSLSKDPETCVKARSDLTNPRNRLAAEVGWLPGVSPHRAIKLLKTLIADPSVFRKKKELFPLALTNLIVGALLRINTSWQPKELAQWFNWLSYTYDKINSESVLLVINEDRTVSGFPEVTSVDLVENEINVKRKYYISVMKQVLDKLPTLRLIDTMTMAVELATNNGQEQASILIDDLVDSYHIEVQGFLEQEQDNINNFMEGIKQNTTINKDEEIIIQHINRLGQMVRNWDKVAQPIQLSTMSRGIEHKESIELATTIRSFAIDVFNDHGFHKAAQHITEILQEVFAEVPEVSEIFEQDVDAIENVIQESKEAAENYENWINEISYNTRVGTILKTPLWISSDGIGYGKKVFPLENVTRVRWGAVTTKSNFSSTTSYTINFGDKNDLSQVEISNSNVFSEFTSKLWKAVCVKILMEMISGLKGGQKHIFSDCTVDDNGIELLRHKFIGADEPVYKKWSELVISNGPGYFSISAPSDKKVYANLYYLDTDNVHILEAAIRILWKRPDAMRLSDIFKE